MGNWYKYGSGYNCTKWVSEQLIIQAIDRGFVNGAISRFVRLEYSDTYLIQHSMGPERSVGLGSCQITE